MLKELILTRSFKGKNCIEFSRFSLIKISQATSEMSEWKPGCRAVCFRLAPTPNVKLNSSEKLSLDSDPDSFSLRFHFRSLEHVLNEINCELSPRI